MDILDINGYQWILIDINGYLMSLHITIYQWIFEKLMNFNGYVYVIEAFLDI